MRLGAGPPLQQLSLSGDDWLIHAEVVRQAYDEHFEELGWLIHPTRELHRLPPTD